MSLLKKGKKKEPETKKPYEIKETVYDFVSKEMKFTEDFLVQAIREKAAREGILMTGDLVPAWHGLRPDGLFFLGDLPEPHATISWRESIKRCIYRECK